MPLVALVEACKVICWLCLVRIDRKYLFYLHVYSVRVKKWEFLHAIKIGRFINLCCLGLDVNFERERSLVRNSHLMFTFSCTLILLLHLVVQVVHKQAVLSFSTFIEGANLFTSSKRNLACTLFAQEFVFTLGYLWCWVKNSIWDW